MESNGVAERTIGSTYWRRARHATRLGFQHGDVRAQQDANEGARRTYAVWSSLRDETGRFAPPRIWSAVRRR
jgi:hypothetical protein